VSNAPSKAVSFSRPKVGYFSNRPHMLVTKSPLYMDSSQSCRLNYGGALILNGLRVSLLQHISLNLNIYKTCSQESSVSMPKLALGPITLLIQWISQAPSARVKQTGVKLTTHLHQVLRLWICGPVTLLSNIPP
jgi:hypothetical protein